MSGASTGMIVTEDGQWDKKDKRYRCHFRSTFDFIVLGHKTNKRVASIITTRTGGPFDSRIAFCAD